MTTPDEDERTARPVLRAPRAAGAPYDPLDVERLANALFREASPAPLAVPAVPPAPTETPTAGLPPSGSASAPAVAPLDAWVLAAPEAPLRFGSALPPLPWIGEHAKRAHDHRPAPEGALYFLPSEAAAPPRRCGGAADLAASLLADAVASVPALEPSAGPKPARGVVTEREAAPSAPEERPPAAPLAPSMGDGYDVEAIRRDFPALQQRVHGRPLVWLDNAATTQKPQAVIDAISRFYARDNSNIHRGAHEMARRATDAYERARETVRRFLGAASTEEIVFVRGTTEAINLVAQAWGRQERGARGRDPPDHARAPREHRPLADAGPREGRLLEGRADHRPRRGRARGVRAAARAPNADRGVHAGEQRARDRGPRAGDGRDGAPAGRPRARGRRAVGAPPAGRTSRTSTPTSSSSPATRSSGPRGSACSTRARSCWRRCRRGRAAGA